MRWWRWRCFNFSITCLAHTWILCVDMPTTSLDMLREGEKNSKIRKMPCNAHCCYPQQLFSFARKTACGFSSHFLNTFIFIRHILSLMKHSFALAAICIAIAEDNFSPFFWLFARSEWRSVPTTHKISSSRQFAPDENSTLRSACYILRASCSIYNVVRRVGENEYKWIFVSE